MIPALTRRTLLACVAASTVSPVWAAQTRDFSAAAAYSAQRRGLSLLVLQGGRVLFEDYPSGERLAGPDAAHELASGTKSFSGVLAAAMVQDGMLSLDEACSDTLTEWRDDPTKRAASVRDLLTLTSGAGGGRIGRPSTYAESVSAPFAGPPGTFRYGPAPFQIFGEIVRRKLAAASQADDVLAFLMARVLGPAGVEYGFWREQDGQPTLPSGAHLTARNWGRFGTFVLAGGRIDGQPIVDPQTLATCFEGTAANPGYGLTWWLLRPGLIPPGRNSGVEASAGNMAGLPDVRMAAGAGDQRLYLVPEHDMVIVRQAGGIRERLRGARTDWSDADFLRLILS